MRILLLSLTMLGAIAVVPARAAPTFQPALAAITVVDQAAVVQTVQYGYGSREYRRRLEFRRREQLRRERLRRQAARHGYYR